MARAFQALMASDELPPKKTVDDYLLWANLVLRTAALLLPYQRPTYRSIEVRTERLEDDRRRVFDNPREELGRMIIGAVLAVQARMGAAPDAAGTPEDRQMTPAEASNDATPAPVDNGDGVLS
jgi:hypothetical protein